MISSPKPPPAPDPAATAAAQTASNQQTAQYQASLNNVNQVTPNGNLTYSYDLSGPGGAPQYTATQTLSPDQRALYDLGNRTQQQIGQIGLDQSKKIGSLLGQPVDLSPGAVDAHLTELGLARLQPQLDRNWQARESQLMNRGIMPGSEAYAREQQAFQQSQNDAYNQLILNGYGQGQQSILAERNQPINEITALLSGSQVSQPNFIGTPQTQVQPTNIGGIYNDAYQNQLAAYNTAQSGNNAMMGGLFGLGSAALMAPMTGGTSLGGWGMSQLMKSDRRFKENIKRVGKLDNGLSVYSYNFKDSGTQIGLMADEVEEIHPSAVVEIGGIQHVNYEMAVR